MLTYIEIPPVNFYRFFLASHI